MGCCGPELNLAGTFARRSCKARSGLGCACPALKYPLTSPRLSDLSLRFQPCGAACPLLPHLVAARLRTRPNRYPDDDNAHTIDPKRPARVNSRKERPYREKMINNAARVAFSSSSSAAIASISRWFSSARPATINSGRKCLRPCKCRETTLPARAVLTGRAGSELQTLRPGTFDLIASRMHPVRVLAKSPICPPNAGKIRVCSI